MCIINVYVDQYPDGKQVEFQSKTHCQLFLDGNPGQPCDKQSTIENPVRMIEFDEPSMEDTWILESLESLPRRIQQQNQIRRRLRVPSVSKIRGWVDVNKRGDQGDDEETDMPEVWLKSSEHQEEATPSTLSEEQRPTRSSFKQQVTEGLANGPSEKTCALCSKPVNPDLKDEQ